MFLPKTLKKHYIFLVKKVQLKQEEKISSESLLASAPKNMPALAYSQDIQQRAAAAGFDWEKTEDILDKLVEEVDELVRASNHEEKTAEFGDILFVLVNLARRLNIDSETALREANRRFYKRFEYMEKACRDKGITFANLSFAEQNTLWEEAKKDISRE